jgi:hypothetical protein
MHAKNRCVPRYVFPFGAYPRCSMLDALQEAIRCRMCRLKPNTWRRAQDPRIVAAVTSGLPALHNTRLVATSDPLNQRTPGNAAKHCWSVSRFHCCHLPIDQNIPDACSCLCEQCLTAGMLDKHLHRVFRYQPHEPASSRLLQASQRTVQPPGLTAAEPSATFPHRHALTQTSICTQSGRAVLTSLGQLTPQHQSRLQHPCRSIVRLSEIHPHLRVPADQVASRRISVR